MKRIAIAGLCITWLAGAGALGAQELPPDSTLSPEGAFLARLAGEWETEGEAYVAPGQPPIETTGTESIRAVGGHWAVSEIESAFMGMPFSAVFTLGFDPESQELVGTWIDSLSSHLWHYEGTLDADGDTLTLEKEGPCFRTPGRHAKYRDVIELEDGGAKTLTSRALVDGEWETMLIIRSRRAE